jgi:hypothetical protein
MRSSVGLYTQAVEGDLAALWKAEGVYAALRHSLTKQTSLTVELRECKAKQEVIAK